MIPNFRINGSIMDVSGMVEGINLRNNLYYVSINTVVVQLPEERLVDFGEYWDKRNAEEKK
jgi:hypothetical protein